MHGVLVESTTIRPKDGVPIKSNDLIIKQFNLIILYQ